MKKQKLQPSTAILLLALVSGLIGAFFIGHAFGYNSGWDDCKTYVVHLLKGYRS